MSILVTLVSRVLGAEKAQALVDTLYIHPALLAEDGPRVSRAVMAQALNMVLFDDLLVRVPAAAAYIADKRKLGEKSVHDHGAVRTVDGPVTGALPRGQAALVRLLTPLGYRQNGHYPLDRLKMTGRSYAQVDFPEDIAQFFVSELHVDRFSPAFGQAVANVLQDSVDPLDATSAATLAAFEQEGAVDLDAAVAALPVIARCFDVHHPAPTLADYEVLKAESAEMAWIATEGNAFNHATDRVPDVDALAAQQKALGRPMKDLVEVSASGRVRQTAFRAAQVMRPFRDGSGAAVQKEVPGSFYEFITRDQMTDETTGGKRLDLGFDSSNAQGIFKMTAAAQ
ncbi:DUF1338 domain-containing protein [Elstera cyanobacteriorum]|uniref:DUF1338 domain-containing protein n=1 Tax=Elstera cyanobacteriorum TaxID=2022747 RepID=UPI002354F3AD|nr:DUF1338 domain-containing protein [Elstera cyanobacteriorum]MCK6442205.1 DUF1338 domain-containing protein [Elstera cyanobacteriorum]